MAEQPVGDQPAAAGNLSLQDQTTNYTYGGPDLGVRMNIHELLRMIDQVRDERDKAPRSDWFIAAAGIFVSIALVAQTSDFKSALLIPASDWKIIWTLVALFFFGAMVVQGCRLGWHWRRHPMRTSEQIYEDILAAHEKQWKELAAIRGKYGPKASEAPANLH
jgi:hypothetical protein